MNVFAIIVAYNPNINQLTRLCSQLSKNGVKIVLVENSEKNTLRGEINFSAIAVIELESNQGIAHAQNVGIEHSLDHGADIIVFFDQDSIINNDFIPNLLSPIKNSDPIVVAPVFFDEQQDFEYPSFRFNGINLLDKIYSDNQTTPYQVDVIISSGSAATKEVFIKGGVMDEDFFIDFVDIEWSIRCRKNKIPIYIVPQAKMTHSIGEKSINLGIMRGFIHSPHRSYYKLRNPFLLLRKSHVPLILTIKEIVAAIVHQFVLLFYVEKKWTYVSCFISAILDGIKGVKGKKQ